MEKRMVKWLVVGSLDDCLDGYDDGRMVGNCDGNLVIQVVMM